MQAPRQDIAVAETERRSADSHTYRTSRERSERHKRTIPLAKFAVEQMELCGLPADPRSFELWFNYAAGINSELNSAINDAIDSPEGLTEAILDHLCDVYLNASRNGARLIALSADLSEEIAQVFGVVHAAASSTGAYERQLGDGLVSFEETNCQEAIKPVIEALVLATRQIEAQTRILMKQLTVSQTRAARLQAEVDLLRKETLTDAVTLVGNRQYFDEVLAHLSTAAPPNKRALSLLFCDIDHFKDFNDKHGHQIGDQVLRLVASLMKQNLRNGDIVARYGGEEFGIILPETPLSVAVDLANRIRSAIAAREVKKRTGQGSFGRITISIGVVQLQPGERANDLLRRADNCLYAAKRSGRNRVATDLDTAAGEQAGTNSTLVPSAEPLRC
jgi:diguanylate cyclase